MAKQPGRRTSARPHSLRIAAYVLLATGVALIATALASKATKLEAASDGLMLIGWPLFILGLLLKGLDWMASYTITAEGTWDHHANRFPGRRARRLRLFRGRRHQVSGFGAAVPETPLAQPQPARKWDVPQATAVPPVQASAVAAPAAQPSRPEPVVETVVEAVVEAVVEPKFEPEPEPEDQPTSLGRTDPGPDTVIEEFVGYEGQDRMLAAREVPTPPPRELAWPNPPRQAEDVSATGSGAFLGKLMDDVMAKLDTADGAGRAAAGAALSAAGAGAGVGAGAASSAVANGAGARSAAASAYPADLPTVAPYVWSRQALHSADHWRFAALVEKLYQQAGFATQLQAGQTMRGVVVLWLFSRHRPGMPASVVSCVHTPGSPLAIEEIVALAELVTERGLSRGQLATTGDVNEAGRQLAAARNVHLMDSDRLLQLISQRTAEQQRILADRLA